MCGRMYRVKIIRHLPYGCSLTTYMCSNKVVALFLGETTGDTTEQEKESESTPKDEEANTSQEKTETTGRYVDKNLSVFNV